jgi:hypothetical protein
VVTFLTWIIYGDFMIGFNGHGVGSAWTPEGYFTWEGPANGND